MLESNIYKQAQMMLVCNNGSTDLDELNLKLHASQNASNSVP